jgi:hypothetical protein
MSSLRFIHYAFSSAGLPAAVAEKHATFAARALARRFELPLEAIHVVHRPRLPEDAPFQLSCYKGKSETCPLAMAVAAKLVLPHLRNARLLLGLPCGPEYLADENLTDLLASSAPLVGWQPGLDLQRDECVLGLLAVGMRLPENDERARWVQAQAAAATTQRDKHARRAGGRFALGNRMRQALVLPGDSSALDIGQVAAALLKHRRDEVVALVAGGAK